MYRGTTPTLSFKLPFDTSDLSAAWVTLAQDGRVIIDKPMSDCVLEGNVLAVTLTQEETLKLTAENRTEVQLRVKTTDGIAMASTIWRVETKKILKEEVI